MKINELPEISNLTNNDLLLAYDSENNITAKIKSSNLNIANTGSISNYSIITDSLVAEYRFDQLTGQQLTDYSSNVLHGTLGSGSSDANQDPVWLDWANAGLDFSNNQYVNLPSRNWFNGNFYIESVIYLRSYQNWSRLVDFSPSPGSINGNVYFGVSNGTQGRATLGIQEGGYTYIVSSSSLTTNKFIHLAAEFKNGVGKIYINGMPSGNGNLPTPTNINRPIAYIGKSQFSGDAYLDAIVARLNIYSKALSNQERANNIVAIKQSLESKGIFFI